MRTERHKAEAAPKISFSPTDELELRPLRNTDERAFRDAFEECRKLEPGWQFAFYFDPACSFKDYVQLVEAWSRGLRLPQGFVPHTYLVGVVGSAIVGRVSIRHELNEFLSMLGGHVGYGVVPSCRRQGYATRMLQLALPVVSSLGITKALITCDADNIASRRVIEKNGGVFEGIVKQPDLAIPKRRYWIDLSGFGQPCSPALR